jgi:hypothetical protein
MARIQAEVVRGSHRDWVREATSLTLLFDDRHGYKMIMFHCDAPSPDSEGTKDGIAARSGLLGINEMLTGVTLEELAKDYAERVVEEIRICCMRFCTPLGDVQDDALTKKLVGCESVVRHLVVDGALRTVCEYLKASLFPQAVMHIRDPTHFLRTAVSEPVEATGNFAKQHAALFTNKHALLKDVQHSRLWQARLEACQNMLVRFPIHSAGNSRPIQHILRHFGYAAHRFESVSGPRRLYVCLMIAIAMLLADIAGDTRRNAEDRKRAEESLKQRRSISWRPGSAVITPKWASGSCATSTSAAPNGIRLPAPTS